MHPTGDNGYATAAHDEIPPPLYRDERLGRLRCTLAAAAENCKVVPSRPWESSKDNLVKGVAEAEMQVKPVSILNFSVALMRLPVLEVAHFSRPLRAALQAFRGR